MQTLAAFPGGELNVENPSLAMGGLGAIALTGVGGCIAVESRLSFDDFYAAHFQKLSVQLYAFAGDATEAQDIVQEAFCRAWARWDKIVQYDDPVAWVRRVAWNIASSRWRKLKTALSFAQKQRAEVVEGPSPDRVALARALATIPENQRKAIVLHYLAGMPVAEIARDCDVAEGTVRSWLHRGRAALHSQLAPVG